MRKAAKPKYTYGVYVIELGGDPNHVYVGQSYLTKNGCTSTAMATNQPPALRRSKG
jgi:hypothetical protein